MATNNIDGAAVSRYQGRINGVFDLDDETEFFVMGDIVMAVVVLSAKGLSFDDNRSGDRIGTYRFGVRDFALVSDEVLRKSLFHHLPHLEPPEQLPFPTPSAFALPLPATEIGVVIGEEGVGFTEVPYHELDDTVMDVDDLREEDILVADSEDGEVFSPSNESRERGRLQQGANDPVLQRFLSGAVDDDV